MTAYRESLDRLTARITLMGEAFNEVTKSIEEIAKAKKRKQKAVDRIAWKAEELQRKAKGGHWK